MEYSQDITKLDKKTTKYIHDYFSSLTFLGKKFNRIEYAKFNLEDIYDEYLLLSTKNRIMLLFYDTHYPEFLSCYIHIYPIDRSEINDITSKDDKIYLFQIHDKTDTGLVNYWETYIVIKKDRLIKFYNPFTGYRIYTQLHEIFDKNLTLSIEKLMPILDLEPLDS